MRACTNNTFGEHRLIRRGEVPEPRDDSAEHRPRASESPEIADAKNLMEAAAARTKQADEVMAASSDRMGGNRWQETADVVQGFEHYPVRLPSRDATVAIRFYNPAAKEQWAWQYVTPDVTGLGDYNRNGFRVTRQPDGNLLVNAKMPFWVSVENKGGARGQMPPAAEKPQEKAARTPKAEASENAESATYTELRKQAEGQILETDFILKTLADGGTPAELTAAQSLLSRMKQTADAAYAERGTYLARDGRFGTAYFALQNRIDALLKTNDTTAAQETPLGKQETQRSSDVSPLEPESASTPAPRPLERAAGGEDVPTVDASAVTMERTTDQPAPAAPDATPAENVRPLENPVQLLERLRRASGGKGIEEIADLTNTLRSPDFAQKTDEEKALVRGKAEAFADAAKTQAKEYADLKNDPAFEHLLTLDERIQLGMNMDKLANASQELAQELSKEHPAQEPSQPVKNEQERRKAAEATLEEMSLANPVIGTPLEEADALIAKFRSGEGSFSELNDQLETLVKKLEGIGYLRKTDTPLLDELDKTKRALWKARDEWRMDERKQDNPQPESAPPPQEAATPTPESPEAIAEQLSDAATAPQLEQMNSLVSRLLSREFATKPAEEQRKLRTEAESLLNETQNAVAQVRKELTKDSLAFLGENNQLKSSA